MGDAEDNNDAWDEWGEDNDGRSPRTEPPAPPLASHAAVARAPPLSAASDAAAPVTQDSSASSTTPRNVLDWAWDLDAIDSDLAMLPPSSSWSITSQPQQALLCRLASLAQPTLCRLQELKSQTHALRAQARVTQWSLRKLRQSLQPEDEAAAADEDELSSRAIHEELQHVAGDWGMDPSVAQHESAQQLHEMSPLLQHALLACDEDDISPFQLAIEQLFSSLPSQSLCIPTTWIRPVTQPHEGDNRLEATAPFDAYLRRLVEICDSSDGRVALLSDAQTFQDAKDIQRDELVVNGEAVVGSIGYDATVTKIEAHIQQAIATLTGDNDNAVSLNTRIRNVAAQVLNAINRTESGGCSYEILSQFVSQHTMDHVLIRPASAKAPPLEIALDLGPFRIMPTMPDVDGEDENEMHWSFGLRVRVSAVTWYCICDANDPTNEFYDVETTYSNRLAFPLGLAPLSSPTLMRRDSGVVTITLHTTADDLLDETAHDGDGVADSTISSINTGDMEQHSGDTTGDVDFDALM